MVTINIVVKQIPVLGSVRCTAKCKEEANCFIEKEKKWWEKLIWKMKN